MSDDRCACGCSAQPESETKDECNCGCGGSEEQAPKDEVLA